MSRKNQAPPTRAVYLRWDNGEEIMFLIPNGLPARLPDKIIVEALPDREVAEMVIDNAKSVGELIGTLNQLF